MTDYFDESNFIEVTSLSDNHRVFIPRYQDDSVTIVSASGMIVPAQNYQEKLVRDTRWVKKWIPKIKCEYCGQQNHIKSLCCEFCGGRLESN